MFLMKKIYVHANGRKEHIKQIKKGFLKEKLEIEHGQEPSTEKKKSLLKSFLKMIKLIRDSDQSLYLSK